MPELGTLHKPNSLAVTLSRSSSAPSPSTLSIISMGRELILQEVGKRDSVHTWVVSVHVRENTGTWIKKLSKAINYWEVCVWEDRTMQESPSTKHIVINHQCFFCVLLKMIRSCLAKEDNKGVHKGTGCLVSSQLNLSWPALLAWAQEHTLPLQHKVLLGTLCPSAAEHFIPVLPSSSQRIELSDFSPIFMWVHQFVCKEKLNPSFSALDVPVLSQPCPSLPPFPPHQPALPVLKKEGTVLLKRDRRALL